MKQPVAIVIDPWDLPFNGAVVSTRRFVSALRQRGVEVRLLALEGEGVDSRDAFRRLSIPLANRIIDAMRAPLARPESAKLKRLLENAGLLHVQYPFFLGAAAIREARRQGIPVICSFHVQPENILKNIRLPSRLLSSLLYRFFIRVFYNQADLVIAPSAFASRVLRDHGLTQPVTVLSNGIPERFFDVVQQPAGEKLQVLSVGRLAREKQQETLLRAVARSRYAERIELTLAGVGPREAFLKALAGELGVNASIGWVDDDMLLAAYGRADLFVHCGTIELEGMSVLEAMAAGNAVVVSDSPASACASIEPLANSRFRMGDPDSLVERLEYWFDHPEERLTEGRRNRRYAEGLAHDREVDRLEALYASLMETADASDIPSRLTGTS